MTAKIRDASPADARAIAAIYNHYIEQTVVTFEEELVTAEEMASRIASVTERYPWLVAELDGTVVGYAYATLWQTRASYRHTVESSVYLDADSTGRGIGAELYQALLDRLPALGVHAVVGGATLPNEASAALHEKLGFEAVGTFREVGRKFDRWLDVGYWLRLIDPPQQTTGNDR